MVFAIHHYESAVGIDVSPPSCTPSHLPPHHIPPGCHRALALGWRHTSNSHRLSPLYTVMYAFQCYSLKSSHPLLLPLSPKSVLYVCLLCSHAHEVVSTVFLDFTTVRLSSVSQSCLTLCDPMNCSMPGLPVHHQLPEFTQTHVHRVGDAIQPSHPRSSPSPPAPNPSQHQSLFQ